MEVVNFKFKRVMPKKRKHARQKESRKGIVACWKLEGVLFPPTRFISHAREPLSPSVSAERLLYFFSKDCFLSEIHKFDVSVMAFFLVLSFFPLLLFLLMSLPPPPCVRSCSRL